MVIWRRTIQIAREKPAATTTLGSLSIKQHPTDRIVHITAFDTPVVEK